MMDKLQACKKTKTLWTEMARVAVEENWTAHKSDIYGPWQDYKCYCPCCEYTKFTDCLSCPMIEEWTVYSTREDAPCEDRRSPYLKWRHLREGYYPIKALCIDVEFFCLLIAEMAEEARTRHIVESQPSRFENKDIGICFSLEGQYLTFLE